jgi:hypothetical protein
VLELLLAVGDILAKGSLRVKAILEATTIEIRPKILLPVTESSQNSTLQFSGGNRNVSGRHARNRQ